MVSTRDSFFETDYEFKTSDGLMIAFGLTGFDEEYSSIEDSDYGELKAYYKTWGMVDAPGVEFIELPTSQCTLAQLGLNQDGTQKEKKER